MRGNLYIIHKLLRSPAVTALSGTRIMPLIAKQGTDLPFISVLKDSVSPSHTKDMSSSLDIDEVTVQINALTYDEAYKLAGLVRSAIDRNTGTIEGIEARNVVYEGESDFMEHEQSRSVYVVEQQYRTHIKRTPDYIRA